MVDETPALIAADPDSKTRRYELARNRMSACNQPRRRSVVPMTRAPLSLGTLGRANRYRHRMSIGGSSRDGVQSQPNDRADFSPESREACLDVYYDQLRTIDLSEFSSGVLLEPGQSPVLASRDERELYADVLFDLSRLLEEVRFETAWAALHLVEWRVARDAGHVEPMPTSHIGLPVSAEIVAGLTAYAQPPPAPTELFGDPHRKVAGRRYLSRWVGAQLLDSALLRVLSSLDRVATLLHLRAGLGIPTHKDGTYRLPTFGSGANKAVEPVYGEHDAWPSYSALTTNELYKLIKRFRNGAIHHRRWPSELHGEVELLYRDAGSGQRGPAPERRYKGLEAQEHLALPIASWHEVLTPAVLHGARLLSRDW